MTLELRFSVVLQLGEKAVIREAGLAHWADVAATVRQLREVLGLPPFNWVRLNPHAVLARFEAPEEGLCLVLKTWVPAPEAMLSPARAPSAPEKPPSSPQAKAKPKPQARRPPQPKPKAAAAARGDLPKGF